VSKKLNGLKVNTLYEKSTYPLLKRGKRERIAYLPIVSKHQGHDVYFVAVASKKHTWRGLCDYQKMRELVGDLRSWRLAWVERIGEDGLDVFAD